MLDQNQVQQLKNEGYSEKEIGEAMEEISREQRLRMQHSEAQNLSLNSRPMSQQTAFNYNPNENLIKWQLEVNEILERAEHIMREDEIEIKNGEIIWTKNSSDTRILNDYGVREIMRILSMYVNRNTILGNYSVEEVYDKVFDFGDRMNCLFLLKYETMGMDTIEKRKNFEMIWGMLVDTVHSAYSRAIGAGERGSLREARSLQQMEQLNPVNNNISLNGMGQQKRSLLNPMRYIKGAFK